MKFPLSYLETSAIDIYVPVSHLRAPTYYILNSCELIQMYQPSASAIIPASLSEGNSLFTVQAT